MSVFLVILLAAIFTCLVIVAGMQPVQSTLGVSELKRRAGKSQKNALELRRQQSYATLTTLLRVVQALLLVLLVCAALGMFGWGFGVVISLLGAVVYWPVARLSFIHRAAQSLYAQLEPSLLDFVARFDRAIYALRDPSTTASVSERRIHSHEDLMELIAHSEDVVGKSEKLLLTSAMKFFDRRVAEVMTPRSVIDFIKHSEFLGPLVLDELHALGHSRLPVITDDLDHVVGVLHLRDLLSLDVKRSTTAEKAMEQKVFYIREDDTLEHALAAFIRTRHHLFIVINKTRETVGLLTLEDVIEALIGRQIVDEDDVHDDLRAVAERESHANNAAPGHVDL